MIDQLDYAQMAVTMQILLHVKDDSDMDETYYLWSCLSDFLVLKNYGVQDLQPQTLALDETMSRMFHYRVMSADELKVMIQGAYTTRSDNYDPKNSFRSPMLATRW